MARFTVLGGSGFIGSALCRYLEAKGHEVQAPGRDWAELGVMPPGHLIYCVGLTTDFARRPLDTVEAHAGTLVDVLGNVKFKSFLYLSSVRLYDGLTADVDEATPLRLDPQNPRHLYDLSKALGEAVTLQLGGRIARLASVFDDALSNDDFICRSVQAARQSRSLVLKTSPNAGRDYIHLDDVVWCLEQIAMHGSYQLYNVASGSVLTNAQLSRLCQTAFGCQVTFSEGRTETSVPCIRIERARNEFGFQPSQATERLPDILRSLRADAMQ